MTFGRLDYERQDNEDYYVINADYETELVIKRLIPSHRTDPLKVRIHPDNTRLIKMVMSEYPLEIKTEKWLEGLADVKKQEILGNQLQNLEYVKPDKSYFLGKLYPFQQQGLDFLLKTKGNTLITDEMGLGKTIEALSYITTKPESLPVVIVSPLVTLVNWKREIEKHVLLGGNRPDNQKTLLNDTMKRNPIIKIVRSGKEEPLEPADFYIINYELLQKRLKDISDRNPKGVVYDEIHYLRNIDTNKYRACKSLASQQNIEFRIGLSGTPIYNRGIEMYNVCEIIKAGLLGDRDEFIRRYCRYWFEPDQTSEEGQSALSKKLKNTIMIRRKKIEVLQDLPEKIRLKQAIPINVEMYEEELQKLFEKIDIAKDQLGAKTTEQGMKEGLFELNKKIREMRIAERQIAGLAKAPHVIEYMENLLSDYVEDKFVIFCHHISVHNAIFHGLRQYNPVQIIGGQSDKQRQDAIDSFQNSEKNRVIICGLRAGNLGINLTASAYVIFAELDWSPSVHRQAEDRLHRIGQKSKVFAHYLEGSGTFDEILSHVLLNKTVEINNALGDKMESINNKKALEYLESRFKTKGKSVIKQLMSIQD